MPAKRLRVFDAQNADVGHDPGQLVTPAKRPSVFDSQRTGGGARQHLISTPTKRLGVFGTTDVELAAFGIGSCNAHEEA